MKQVILIHGLPSKEEVINDVWPSPVGEIKEKLPNIKMHVFTGKKHFNENHLNSKEFPELLELILEI